MTAGEDTQNLGRPGEPVLSPDERDILRAVYQALKEKGYSPVTQLAHYLLSGEPAYITSHQSARSLIVKLERETIIEELIRHYFDTGVSSD